MYIIVYTVHIAMDMSGPQVAIVNGKSKRAYVRACIVVLFEYCVSHSARDALKYTLLLSDSSARNQQHPAVQRYSDTTATGGYEFLFFLFPGKKIIPITRGALIHCTAVYAELQNITPCVYTFFFV